MAGRRRARATGSRARAQRGEGERERGARADEHEDQPRGYELSAMLRDPALSILLTSFAEEQGAGADLRLFSQVQEVVGEGGDQGRTWCTPTPCTFH